MAAGAANVELRFPALGVIEGVLEGFGAPPSVTAYPKRDEVLRPLRASVTGTRFTFERVPAGTYDVVAKSDDGIARATTTVDAKTPARVVLRHQGVGAIEGRVLLEDTREPVAHAACVSGSSEGYSDESGAFRLERVEPGTAEVACFGGKVFAHASVVVTAGKAAHVELIAKKSGRTPTRGYAGLELEIRGGDVAVKNVVPAGPADRVGIKSGDVLLEIDQYEVDAIRGPQGVLRWIEMRGPEARVKLKLERDGKERVVELELEQRP